MLRRVEPASDFSESAILGVAKQSLNPAKKARASVTLLTKFKKGYVMFENHAEEKDCRFYDCVDHIFMLVNIQS